MSVRRLQIGLLVLVALSISVGPLAASLVLRDAGRVVAVPGETPVDACDAEVELLPLFVAAPHAPRWLVEHCHEVIPESADESAERIIVDDHAARGPPAG